MNIYHFPFSDRRFLNLKLEEFENDYQSTISRIAGHLEFSEEILLRVSKPFDLNTIVNYPAYVTRSQLDTKTYHSLFQPHHYDLFRELFPPDTLSRLGYEN